MLHSLQRDVIAPKPDHRDQVRRHLVPAERHAGLRDEGPGRLLLGQAEQPRAQEAKRGAVRDAITAAQHPGLCRRPTTPLQQHARLAEQQLVSEHPPLLSQQEWRPAALHGRNGQHERPRSQHQGRSTVQPSQAAACQTDTDAALHRGLSRIAPHGLHDQAHGQEDDAAAHAKRGQRRRTRVAGHLVRPPIRQPDLEQHIL